MRELFDTRLNVDDRPLTKAELAEAVQSADVLVPTVTDKVDRSVLAQAGPQLKLIANFGTALTILISKRRATARLSSPTRRVS